MNTEEDKKTDQEPKIFNLRRQGRSFRVSRRDFLKISAPVVAATSLSSCVAKPQADPIATKAPATSTPPPTPTPTRTLTPTPTKIPVTASTRSKGVRLREWPSTLAQVVGVLDINVSVTVIGKLADESWLQIAVNLEDLPELKDAPIAQQGSTVAGWMRADLLEILSGSLQDIEAVEPLPTPTPLPNQKPTGKEGITYTYTDLYGTTHTYTLPCGAPIPAGAVCTCNCVAVCSCVSYVAPTCNCDKHKGSGGSICTCNMVTYWYPN
ncbi:MAG TPA: twin-arginine translocation signal domain-containing protein [Anaerolineales bacterium]|nr:twin-arginine translocation signal domain-containing protein [Anaerolineales bacterium]